MVSPVVGLGHALLDCLIPIADEHILSRHLLVRGAFNPIHPTLADLLEPLAESRVPGGSIANSLAVIAAAGGTAAFIGKIGDDDAGAVFRREMNATRLAFGTPAKPGVGTGRCVVFISPDGERTMATSIGASNDLRTQDLDPELIRSARIFMFDGYLLGPSPTAEVAEAACRIARAAGVPIATSLADARLVTRNLDQFQAFVDRYVDILFANGDELAAFTGETDPLEALSCFSCLPSLTVFATRGSQGALVHHAGRTTAVPAHPVPRVVDTTGAGDAFAGGVLYGLSHGQDPISAARLGGIAASRIIGQIGARPRESFEDLLVTAA